jgi:3-oxoacyl-[acyl-carrier-protein] synthase III
MQHHLDCSIESLGVYLPENVVSTSKLLSSCSYVVRRGLKAVTGIESRHIAGDQEYSIDLARKASIRCLANSRYKEQDIELLIVCSICRFDGPGLQFSHEPNTSFKLAAQLNLENALTFDISNACAGMFTGIAIARSFIGSGAVRNALVASGEYISHIALTAQKEITGLTDARLASLTLGDAGAAVLLERSSSPGVGFLDIDLYTLSSHSELCVAQPTSESHGGVIMMTDAAKMAEVAIREGIAHSAYVLERNGWPARAVDHWLVHQTSKRTISKVRSEIEKRFALDDSTENSVIDNLRNRGNTASTSHFVALADHIESGRIRTGDKILFGVAASGITIGTALYAIDDLPGRHQRETKSSVPGSNGKPSPLLTGRRSKVRVESIGAVPDGLSSRMTDREAAKRAVEYCLSKSVYKKEEIDLVVFCGVYRSDFVFEPAIATLIAREVGIGSERCSEDWRGRAFAFDVFNGALGFLTACVISAQMIETGQYKTALIVASEGGLDNESMRLRGITETASAAILDAAKGDGAGFEAFSFQNFPKYEQAFVSQLWVQPGKAELRYEASGDISDAYLECIGEGVAKFLARQQIDLSLLSFIIGPQLGSNFSRRLSTLLDFPENQIVSVGGDGADLFTSSFSYGMHYLEERGRVRSGDLALTVAVGPGLQVGCATYRF